MHDDLEQRKSQHLDIALRPDVEPDGDGPLWRCVRFVHCALPELRVDEVDLSATLCGVKLRAPLMIVGMTGGTARAAQINRDLAQLAEEEGIAFGVGSMRVVLRDPAALATFDVRPARPPLLLANLGAQQLVQTPDAAQRLIDALGADGICIHLNPGQELVQEEGDRDFTGCLDAIGALAHTLGPKLVVKETGCGISPSVARALRDRGVTTIDVSGEGGTSWTRVEQLRAHAPAAQALGALLSDWGIPAAAAIGGARKAVGASAQLVSSGGIRTGLDAARAIALGADIAGFALPLLRAHQTGGLDGARATLRGIVEALRAVCLLVGAKDVAALQATRPVLLEPLTGWLRQLELAK